MLDLFDSFADMLRTGIIAILSKKLTRDLRFEYNYGVGKIEAIAALLCDGIIFFGLLTTLALSVHEFIFPSRPSDLLIAVYMMIGCIKRTRSALDELTDKTLPEDMQLKIMAIMSRFYDRYSQLHAVKSRKNGDSLNVDLHISFYPDTTFEQIVAFKSDVQTELNKVIDACAVSIVVQQQTE